MSDRVDVAIVGAGAAGIAAARSLASHGRSILLIEALPRLGGRAHTDRIAGVPLDLGCGWLHSAERNPLAALAEARGEPLDRRRSAWHKQLRDLGIPAGEQQDAWPPMSVSEKPCVASRRQATGRETRSRPRTAGGRSSTG